ncbi:cilia- and flagella-associated protein 45 isoform X3 [Lutra lutra]|uniref:cilia- and flagella-associated protein 45 isoform X3 n=1 Tax=Lutra lutra TaxID=9657 RepID=UPI001FD175E3|nr:cilia- and flagella-associated protein 45 isoform X3 [Lutra lutra]
MLENSQDPCIKGVQRPQERGENSPRPTQTLGSLWLPAFLSVWPSYPPAASRTLGLAGPWPARRRLLNASSTEGEREREIERDRRESASLLALGDALQRAARLVLTFGSSGSFLPGSSHVNVLLHQGPDSYPSGLSQCGERVGTPAGCGRGPGGLQGPVGREGAAGVPSAPRGPRGGFSGSGDAPLSTAGILSSASTASNRSRNRTRYRTKAVSSEVDESLFGGVKPLAQSNSPIVLLRDKHAIRKTLTALGLENKPETIQLITRDMVRELIVPAKDPSGESLIMSPEEFERIKSASHVLTREELEAREQAFKKEKEAIVDAVTKRKKVMKQKEMARRNTEKLSDLEEVAQERAQSLLQRASVLRMEQEEELKDMSKIILNAKCHAIRDAQILEKQLIQRELDAEERRLDQMMEVERQKSIQRQEELDWKRREERIRGRRHIVEQMEKNQEERSLLAEQREQEKEQMLGYMEQLQEEDLRDMEQRHQQKLKMQAEIKRINDENQKQKAELLAQEKLADQMVMEFTKKKMAREAEFEAEQERIRREKEKEITRLRAMQEKAQDYQAEQDALRAKRNQEVADREWRRKEKENAQKKMETEAKLRSSRLEQVAFKEHSLAVQVQRDRDEFERILRAQREQIEKERLEEEKKATGRLRHANELRRQVRENQQKQVQDRIATFEEGRRLKEEAQKRRERIDDIKKKKIEELRATGLPEKYCIEAERKANILPATSVN